MKVPTYAERVPANVREADAEKVKTLAVCSADNNFMSHIKGNVGIDELLLTNKIKNRSKSRRPRQREILSLVGNESDSRQPLTF